MLTQTFAQIRRDAFPIVTAGAIGEAMFELYAWLLSPAMFGVSLQPAKLVMAIGSQYFGVALTYPVAFAIHVLIGSLVFGGCVYIAMTAAKSIFTAAIHAGSRIWMSGVLTGLALWFFAQGILAPLVGRSFMMNFGPYTQSSLIGHVGMTVVIAVTLGILLARPPNDAY